MKRMLMLVLLIAPLAGCFSLNGLATTSTSTVAAVAGTTLVSPAAGIATGLIAGVATDAALPDVQVEPIDYAGTDGELNFWEMLAFMYANFTQHIISIGIVVGLFWLLTNYFMARMPRREEKAAEKQVKLLVDKIGQMKER